MTDAITIKRCLAFKWDGKKATYKIELSNGDVLFGDGEGVPRPELIDALVALEDHAKTILGISVHGRMVVNSVSTTRDKKSEEDYNFTISSTIYPKDGPGAASITTPLRGTAQGSKSVDDDVIDAVELVLSLALSYARNDRAQLDIFENANEA